MIPLPPRILHAVATVVDVALYARPRPVSAKALAARHDLPARHLETVLQALVRSGILKGMRGPRGGYELGRERRRVSVGDIVRAVLAGSAGADDQDRRPDTAFLGDVVMPAMAGASEAFLAHLDRISIDDLCTQAGPRQADTTDFTI